MNKDNYKNAIDQIHASNELKEKTIRKMKQTKQNKISYIKILSSVAVILIIFSIGIFIIIFIHLQNLLLIFPLRFLLL